MFSTKFVTVLLHLDSQGLKFLENVKGIAEKHPKGKFMSLKKWPKLLIFGHQLEDN